MSDTIEARANYGISNLLPSQARWLAKNIDNQEIQNEFLDKLKFYFHSTHTNPADLDQVFCLAVQLKKENILSKISNLDIAKTLYSSDQKVIDSFLSGLNTRRKNLVKAALAVLQNTNAIVENLTDTPIQKTESLIEAYSTGYKKKTTSHKGKKGELFIARNYAGRFMEKMIRSPKKKSAGSSKK